MAERRKPSEIYRKVSVRMWGDDRFRALSKPTPNAQSLWQFLLTGPFTTQIPGLLIGGPAGMAEVLEWPVEGFLATFAEPFGKGMCEADWKARLVWVQNAIKHNEPESPNVVRGWRRTWPLVPECSLKWKAYRGLRSYCERMGPTFLEGFLEGFGEGLGEPSPNQEQEQEQEVLPGTGARTGTGTVLPPPAEPGESIQPVRASSAATPEQVLEAWNDSRGNLPEASKLTELRRKHAKARQSPERTPDWWRALFRRLAASPFCSGENDRGWRADIDFAIRSEDQVVKILEGRYDANGTKKKFMSVREMADQTIEWGNDDDEKRSG